MPAPFVERTIVNGNAMRRFTDSQDVSIMLRVSDEAGSYLNAVSTDGQEIRVELPNNEPIGARKGNWVEIIGTPSGSNKVKAKEAILFGDENIDFDSESYDMLVTFLNNAKEIYRSG